MQDRIWELFVELRKELLESQRIRAQVIGIKITFVTTAMGVIIEGIARLEFSFALLVIPAIAAVFFDFLIYSYSFSIKRIGAYTREHIEPALAESGQVPEGYVQWQAYLTQPKTRQTLALYGNLGLTSLAIVSAVVSLVVLYDPKISIPLLLVLGLSAALDVIAYRTPRRLGKLWQDVDGH
ncbi:hypothetical protein KKG90_06215 [Candidatus Bipolaricaulota bacterium]|nr:hypothetical protein [Candidatus Bipolaricaulota bacterium]